MITVRGGVRPEEVRQSARYVLFVEGSSGEGIDVTVLRELLGDLIRVEALGASYHIRSAADALYKYHPDYYFIVDRDHFDNAFVEACWQSFPNPDCSNLLVWRQREIENYFLDPEYLCHSGLLRVTPEELKRRVKKHCSDRLFLDAANAVIISIREDQKQNWIGLFPNPSEFKTEAESLTRLCERAELAERKKAVARSVTKTEIGKRLRKILQDMTGGTIPLEYGRGNWLQRVRGKKILQQIVSTCCTVKDTDGRQVQGSARLNEVVKALVRQDMSRQPEDFHQLHDLIKTRVESS